MADSGSDQADNDAFYGDSHRALQERFETRRLADTLEAAIVTDELDEVATSFIESRDFFFLSTVDERGHPTVSHKGGAPGFVRVADPTTLVFPSYDGNGMYLSMGNIAADGRIGMLFMDFETPHRVRVQATASLSENDPMADQFPGAELIVRASIDAAFVNCSRYIHKHGRVEQSAAVPDADGSFPLASWKKIDAFQDVLAPADQARAAQEGELLTYEEYGARMANGEA